MSDEETMENGAITYYFENIGEQITDKVLEVANAKGFRTEGEERSCCFNPWRSRNKTAEAFKDMGIGGHRDYTSNRAKCWSTAIN